jgi:polyisoprenoid-binding protein YceI
MATTKWTLDPAHSEIEFKVRHMMIANVKGNFQSFTAEIDGEDFETATATVEIDAASINTNQADRDGHLRSDDFFGAEKFPKIIFRGKSLTKKHGDEYKLVGDLTIRDITKEISLDVESGGVNKDPWGNDKAGFTVDGKISRKEWGLNWNAALETGGVLVSDEVKVHAEVQFTKSVQE